MRNRHNPNEGFTLLETLIALCLLSIVLIAAIRLQTQTIAALSESAFDASAPLLAQRKMTDLESSDPSKWIKSSGHFESPFETYAYNIDLSDFSSEILGETAKQMKRIDLTVTDGEGRRFSMRKYLYAPISEKNQ